MKKVLVEWLDSRRTTSEWEWLDAFEFEQPARIKTLGYLIRETVDGIWIAQSLSVEEERQQVSGVMTIPRRAVLGIAEVCA